MWQIEAIIAGKPLEKDGGLNRERFTFWLDKISDWRRTSEKFGMKITRVDKATNPVAQAKELRRLQFLRPHRHMGLQDDAFDDTDLPDVVIV